MKLFILKNDGRWRVEFEDGFKVSQTFETYTEARDYIAMRKEQERRFLADRTDREELLKINRWLSKEQ